MVDKIVTSSVWFKIVNDNVKVIPEVATQYGISTDRCTVCQYIIVSESYQHSQCGSRYCKDCFDGMDEKYYCDVCRLDNEEDFVHIKKDLFVDKALIKDLERTKFKCPDCNSEMKIIDLQNHVKTCKKGWEQCPRCCEMVKKDPPHKCNPSLDMTNRNQSKYKVCQSCGKECIKTEDHKPQCSIDWSKGCPYGCSAKGNDHRKEKFLFHLDKAWAILQSNGLAEIKHESSPDYKKMLRPIIENIRESLGIQVDSIVKLSNELKALNTTVKEENAIYDDIKTILKSQISDSLYTSFDGTILWRIDNFDDVKAKAIKGEQKSIFSPPFYTSRFGYKMCLRLYPNGDSTAWDVAMSLFLVIMKGNYDALLTWPFKQKVTFILLDQEFKTNMIDAFVPSENLTSFSRPRSDMNIPSGSSYFIKFEDMDQRKYVKENTVFIRCIIDCSDLHE